uniref:Small integral membrane protein 8 n=1 Tax=Pavo cristatus TaxID=9049 RepID=A0A8C9L694_PAVCR
MSSSKTPNENETPKERNPGLRGTRTTTLFRAVNPELFIKPVRGSFDHYRVASKSNFKVRRSDEDLYQIVPCGSDWREVVVTFP